MKIVNDFGGYFHRLIIFYEEEIRAEHSLISILCDVERLDLTGVALTALGEGLMYRGITGHSFLYQANRILERLQMATQQSKAEVINYEGTDVVEMLKQMTGRRGPSPVLTL